MLLLTRCTLCAYLHTVACGPAMHIFGAKCITSPRNPMFGKMWQVGQIRVCTQGEYLCPACTAGTRSIGADLFAHVKPGCKHTARECFSSGSGHLYMGQILRLLKSEHKSDTYKMCVRRYVAPRDPALVLRDRDKVLPSTLLRSLASTSHAGVLLVLPVTT